MPSEPASSHALERIEPLLERLDLDACLRNLKETWAVNQVDDGDGSERTRALYTYARPEYAVAQAMADGAAPEDALREWQAAINKMLAEFRPKRRHSLLVEATSALRHAGAPLPGQPTHTPAAGAKALETTGGISPIHLALATLAVYQTSDIRYLLGELAASTAPLPGWDKPPQLDLQLIQQSLRTTRQAYDALETELATTQAQLKEHQEENELLLLQLHQVQEELETTYQQASERLKKVERLTRDLETAKAERSQLERQTTEQRTALETELATTQTQLEDHQEENELLLLQLHQVQEELEHYYLRNLELEEETKRKQAKESTTKRKKEKEQQDSIQRLERRIDLIEHSTSWRLTAPLRRFTQILLGKGGPPQPPDASAPEEKRIRYLQRRIEQLETSTSWKATAPLRTVGLMFKAESKNSAKKKG